MEIEFADVVKVPGTPLVQTCDPAEVVRLHLGDVALMGACASRGVPRSTKDDNVERISWGDRVTFTARNVYAIERRKED